MRGMTQTEQRMTNGELWQEYIKLLEHANDETQSQAQHANALRTLNGWLAGVKAATGWHFNGDYHYIDQGIDRLMCCGQFLDWKEAQG